MSAAIAWFRRDLRVADNPALAAAAEAGDVVPAFVFERGLHSGRHASPSRNAYLLASLRELDEALREARARLHYRSGDPAREIPALAAQCGAAEVHVNRDHTAHARSRDRRVAAALAEQGRELVGHPGITCAEIARIENASGKPFRVFSPFARAWNGAPRRPLVAAPRKLRGHHAVKVGRPPAEAELGIDATAKRIVAAAGPGERTGRARVAAAIGSSGEYLDVRDLPGADATSRLSPPLHFGTVSPRELETLLIEEGTQGAEGLRRQLAWRDFWLSVIRNFPENRTEEHDARMRGMGWREDPAGLRAWKAGRTGIPWVDAGMRQLLGEGWMHNRLRMAVGSFLTKNLLIDWREGEAHFMRLLLDGDESQNNGNWQWVASTGADPQPYFRVFNPVLQQGKLDPEGTYVRRWVPELHGLADGHLAEPWKAPAAVQRAAGCVIGTDYPEPIVELKDSRKRAIAQFEDHRD